MSIAVVVDSLMTPEGTATTAHRSVVRGNGQLRSSLPSKPDVLASAEWETDGGRVLVDLAEVSGDVLARAIACRSRKTRGCA
jgi:hypothetical protein